MRRWAQWGEQRTIRPLCPYMAHIFYSKHHFCLLLSHCVSDAWKWHFTLLSRASKTDGQWWCFSFKPGFFGIQMESCDDDVEQLGFTLEAVGISFSDTSRVEAEDLTCQVSHALSKEAKLAAMKHLEVEHELLRGIGLRASLQNGGCVWMTPADKLSSGEKMDRWQTSIKVDHFDVFISHTWLTAGRWKILCLLLDSSWPIMLLGWTLAVLAAIPSHLVDFSFPMTLVYSCTSLDFEGTCSSHLFAHYLGLVGTLIGLLAAPYLRCCDKMCFLDVVSINQTEEEKEVGIYAIGGFLAVSAELIILWDRPYFSRLWCIFELAAFRKCNPQGKITLKPLFVETCVAVGLVFIYLQKFMNWAFHTIGWPDTLSLVLRLIATLAFTHYFRELLYTRCQLINDLRNFELTHVNCGSDFDRDFIYAGIEAWYGSSASFTEYVRGPLADELAKPFSKFRVSRAYWALAATPSVTWELCWLLSLIRADASDAAILWMFMLRTSNVLLDLICMKLLVMICDFFASPYRWNSGKTFCVWAGWAMSTWGLWQLKLFADSQDQFAAVLSCLTLVIAFVTPWWNQGISLTKSCDPAKSAKHFSLYHLLQVHLVLHHWLRIM